MEAGSKKIEAWRLIRLTSYFLFALFLWKTAATFLLIGDCPGSEDKDFGNCWSKKEYTETASRYAFGFIIAAYVAALVTDTWRMVRRSQPRSGS